MPKQSKEAQDRLHAPMDHAFWLAVRQGVLYAQQELADKNAHVNTADSLQAIPSKNSWKPLTIILMRDMTPLPHPVFSRTPSLFSTSYLQGEYRLSASTMISRGKSRGWHITDPIHISRVLRPPSLCATPLTEKEMSLSHAGIPAWEPVYTSLAAEALKISLRTTRR